MIQIFIYNSNSYNLLTKSIGIVNKIFEMIFHFILGWIIYIRVNVLKNDEAWYLPLPIILKNLY